jgi:hypothetical protein
VLRPPSGDRRACEHGRFDEFVGTGADALMRYAYGSTRDPYDATNVLEDSLARVNGASGLAA